MTDETLEPTAGRAEPAIETARRRRGRRAAGPIELTEAALEALLFVAERPLSRREIAALAGTDRATVDARLGDLEVSLRDRGIRLLIDGDRVELATAPEGGALVARYVGADAVRLSPASRSRRWPSSPTASPSRRRPSSASAASTPTTRSGRCSIAGSSWSSAGPRRPGRPFLYGTGFEFLERFGLTSLEELPPLDVDVAARLAEEGGEPMTEPLFEAPTATTADAAADAAEARSTRPPSRP